jgi:hypothetical protein
VGYKEYTTSKLVNVLLGRSIDKSLVCSRVPMRNQTNGTFIIDMEKIKDPMDLRADDNGAWLHNGLRCVWVSVCKNRVEILSRKKKRPKCQLSGGAKLYCLQKAYHALKSSPDFRRLIATLEGMHNSIVTVV